MRTTPESSSVVAVYPGTRDEAVQSRAAEIAGRLSLPLVQAFDAEYPLLLAVMPERIELRVTQPGGPGPVYVDFVGGAVGYGRRAGGSRLLFRAIGSGTHSVIDATAGLGRDAFAFACRGCHVIAIERSPIVAELLRDGIARARRDPKVQAAMGERLQLVVGDARCFLRDIASDQAPEVVYLDPMFPPARKTALVKKEMVVLRRLVGDDDNGRELLDFARAVVRRHVVVKRMHGAPPLAPDITRTYKGESTRYDVYAPRSSRRPE